MRGTIAALATALAVYGVTMHAQGRQVTVPGGGTLPFSLAVKVVEHAVFGTWDHGHFFHVFKGNAAYIIGWSVADGLYPPITFYGLRIVSRFVRGLVVL